MDQARVGRANTGAPWRVFQLREPTLFPLLRPAGLQEPARLHSKGWELMARGRIYGRSRAMESRYVLGEGREGLAKDECDSQSSEGEV